MLTSAPFLLFCVARRAHRLLPQGRVFSILVGSARGETLAKEG
jgi:hypothetical protein